MTISEWDGELDFTLDPPANVSFDNWSGQPAFFRGSRLFTIEDMEEVMVPWRLKERMKTVSVALVACLNIRVDPPDVVKPSPCARMECWTDPYSTTPAKALEQIGKNLEAQYQRWQPRAKFKQSLDPTVEEVKKLCDSLRRSAKDERVLFHYNGHGVPRPTTNSEIWVFNKNFTQYIPLSIYDLQTWLGSPSIYVFDCSSAGVLINNQQNQDDHIIFAACAAGEFLPQNPDLPADMFTSCLTTPIKMALRWFCTRSSPLLQMDPDLVDKIPGRLNERKTVLGELNWIFTAITDTIAWNLLPPELFQRLFRQDLLVASIFRNFILAERLLRSVNCTPVSVPRLPPSYQHPLWAAWDLAADVCLAQLPDLLSNPNAEYQHSTFFTEQLTAFEVWLEFGSNTKSKPLELPIVLQVLLSQVHRLRALMLLARFLDMGSWAVNHALSVGIFPYVLKLLSSPALELKEALVFIWTKILTVDKTCQIDLIRDLGHIYFLNVLSSPESPDNQQAMSLAVMSVIVSDYSEGKEKSMDKGLIEVLKAKIDLPCPHIRRWVCLCAGKLWTNSENAKAAALSEKLAQAVGERLRDRVPEVRAAALYALSKFIGTDKEADEGGEGKDSRGETREGDGNSGEGKDGGGGRTSAGARANALREQDVKARIDVELDLAMNALACLSDGSVVVRRELVLFLASLVRRFEDGMVRAGVRAGWGVGPLRQWDTLSANLQVPILLEEADGLWLQVYNSESSAEGGAGARAGGTMGGVAGSQGGSMAQSPYSAPKIPVPAVKRGSPVHKRGGSERLGEESDSGVPFPTLACTNVLNSLVRLTRDPVGDITQGATTLLIFIEDKISRPRRGSASRDGIAQQVHSSGEWAGVGGRTLSMDFSRGEGSGPRGGGRGSNMRHVASDGRGGEGVPGGRLGSSPHAQRTGGRMSSVPEKSPSSDRGFLGKVTDLLRKTPTKSNPGSSPSKLGVGGTPGARGAVSGPLVIDDDAIGRDTADLSKPRSDCMGKVGSMRSSFYEANLSLLRNRLLRANQVEREVSEMDQRRKVEIGRRTQVARNLCKLSSPRIEQQLTAFDNEGRIPSNMLFHPHAPLLICSDDTNVVSLWQFGDQFTGLANTFRNKNPPRSHLTSLLLLNECDANLGLLFIASDDGMVRGWRGFGQNGEERLVTGWNAAPEMVPDQRGPGTVMHYEPTGRLLAVGGSSPFIRLWDLESEKCTQMFKSGSKRSITSITSAGDSGSTLIVAGCGDGVIHLYDSRTPSTPLQQADSSTISLSEHATPIIHVSSLVSSTGMNVISGSSSGEVKIWDIRSHSSVLTFQAHKEPMSAMAVHPAAPVIATGSSGVALHSVKGELLNTIKYHEGFMGHKIGPVCSLAMHPLGLLLATGSADSIISIYTQ